MLALDLLGPKYETRERAKCAPSASQTWDVKIVELGRFRADSERAESAERSIIRAAVRVGES